MIPKAAPLALQRFAAPFCSLFWFCKLQFSFLGSVCLISNIYSRSRQAHTKPVCYLLNH